MKPRTDDEEVLAELDSIARHVLDTIGAALVNRYTLLPHERAELWHLLKPELVRLVAAGRAEELRWMHMEASTQGYTIQQFADRIRARLREVDPKP